MSLLSTEANLSQTSVKYVKAEQNLAKSIFRPQICKYFSIYLVLWTWIVVEIAKVSWGGFLVVFFTFFLAYKFNRPILTEKALSC